MDAADLLDRPHDDPLTLLSADGELAAGYEPDLTDDELVALYADMRLYRRFDERCVSLQRQGRMGTYAPLAGQEAAQVGTTYAFAPEDWMVYQYREHGIPLSRGVVGGYLQYWMGHEAGNATLADATVLPLNISIGSQVPHAAGLGMAIDYEDDDAVVCCQFGDGATSEGDVHEGLNFASVFDAPVVFVCNNNQWAISVPREDQTASATIAQKAQAYGFRGIQVDGMDPLAVYETTRAAAEQARDPDPALVDEAVGRASKPILIETLTYRYGAHTTADDPSAYRDEAEVERWKELDPIDRMETFLRRTGRLDGDRIDGIESRIEETVAEAIDAAEAVEADPLSMFEHVYEEQPARLGEQHRELATLRERHGDDALTRDE
ncbi:pyruvate dehydrogenase E1 component, alpha subunit [Salinarchaeum sp. Harcht-Bsk1]|uniref:pyruvate dehydrogenase (acetyl-transferring) E1 component subunit alpha n=1 Tax=Salinarchaeum sp. Harcht-Bsk1 TaxID=1333523 RepID=UPI0003423980|nr:pyruvate dehydrogenase (acetyl-transferring) E1 component subunit alpha [Salinarchaeum sp. Harcht-Bsk1]AGN00415.1 pyruvate dehydrogenase E1 component, alpha subunit [Salinarchaeum sp. Harcht-Bsk1]